MLRATSLFLLVLAFSMAAGATPEEEAASRHPLTNLPPGGDISTSYYFPDYPNKKFPAGEQIKVVLGIHNDATEPYNITMVMGSLNNPQDFSAHYQNFSQEVYLLKVLPQEELSVEYTFRPDPLLPPRDFIVALTVFYHQSETQWYSTTFFNQTIDIVEKKKLVDSELILMILTLIAMAAGIGYLFLDTLTGAVQKLGLMKKGKGKSRSKKTETVRADDSEDWVKGTPYDNFRKKQAKLASARSS